MKKVRVQLGRTISLKQYESLRVDVAVENEASTEEHNTPNGQLFVMTLAECKEQLQIAIKEAQRDTR